MKRIGTEELCDNSIRDDDDADGQDWSSDEEKYYYVARVITRKIGA